MKLSLPAGIRVYAIGDIHGEAGLLDALFDAIDADLAARPPVGEVLEVFLGDYIDRGPDVAGVIDRIRRTPRPGRSRVCLLGNHEDAMLGALSDPHRIDEWRSYGAAATFRAYGIDQSRHRDDAETLRALLDAVPAEHRDFLEGLPLMHRIGDVLFVHAGIRPGVPVDEQAREDLIWIRNEFLSHRGPLPVHVVHGHTPTALPEVLEHRTNVDTGAVYGGSLTAAVIEGETLRFLAVPAR